MLVYWTSQLTKPIVWSDLIFTMYLSDGERKYCSHCTDWKLITEKTKSFICLIGDRVRSWTQGFASKSIAVCSIATLVIRSWRLCLGLYSIVFMMLKAPLPKLTLKKEEKQTLGRLRTRDFQTFFKPLTKNGVLKCSFSSLISSGT